MATEPAPIAALEPAAAAAPYVAMCPSCHSDWYLPLDSIAAEIAMGLRLYCGGGCKWVSECGAQDWDAGGVHYYSSDEETRWEYDIEW